jgi:hypothetical protein
MRKFYIVVLIAILVFSMATPAVAGGDKNHGDNDSPNIGPAERHTELSDNCTMDDYQRCKPPDSP